MVLAFYLIVMDTDRESVLYKINSSVKDFLAKLTGVGYQGRPKLGKYLAILKVYLSTAEHEFFPELLLDGIHKPSFVLETIGFRYFQNDLKH